MSPNDRDMEGAVVTRAFDTTVPNVARIYDFMLGGKDNYAADRDAAERVMREIPHSALACRQNRRFLDRVVRVLADAGIRQFIDIGSGLPTATNVHEIAEAAAPGSRTVYVDYDRVVVTHAKALLEKGSAGVLVVQADLRDPGAVIGGAQRLIDFSEPVALLLFAVLHFLTDADQPYKVVRSLVEAVVPGSAVALSHFTDEAIEPEASLAVQQIYQGASAPAVPRSREAVTRFFDSLELTGPGVTDISLWPVNTADLRIPLTFYGGVAVQRKQT